MSDLSEKLTRKEVQDFINKNLKTDVSKLILKGSPFPELSVKTIATQIEGKNKSEKKLPTWFKTNGIIYPAKLNLEQSSSEITAQYKASLINNGSLVDLTGGFGIDDYYFAQKATTVTHCEINEELSAIVKHNFEMLGVKNVTTLTGNSNQLLKKSNGFDTIYIDPSRRANSGRVFLLKDCEPDVLANQEKYLQKAKRVIIKAAPMLDIQSAIKDLKNVAEVHVVSVKNECKELLFILEQKPVAEPVINCVLLNGAETKVISFNITAEKTAETKPGKLLNYLYEPDASILKAGMFKLLTEKYPVTKVHQHSHLYTSNELIDFPGKRFKIIKTILFNDFTKAQVPKQINVVCRNFNLKPDELKKNFKLKDGGSDFLFFSTNYKEQKIVIQAQKV
jgi:precorrin-6B methylase 2